MKPFMILGALVGFLIGSGFALTGRSSWPTALWHASAAALGAAWLTRWWANVWVQGLQESLARRRAARPALPSQGKPGAKT